MAPTLLGPHAVLTCEQCGAGLKVGLDQLPDRAELKCPSCRTGRLPLAEAGRGAADQLIVDRRLGWLASPQRWDVVVLRQPDDARRWCVKRVLGLPGESVQLIGGDLVVDGEVVRKSLDEQRRLRVPIDDNPPGKHWAPSSGGWRKSADGWVCSLPDSGGATLRYTPPGGGAITDDLSHNQLVTRRLQVVRDLMLTAELETEEGAIVELAIGSGKQRVAARFERVDPALRVSLIKNDGSVSAACEERRDRDGPVLATLSIIDRQALIAVGDDTLLTAPLGAGKPSQEVSVTARSGGVTVTDLRLWRDVHYEVRPRDDPTLAAEGRRLGGDEWFVVGDNQAVSHDSRSWAPAPGIPGRLLLGRVIGK